MPKLTHKPDRTGGESKKKTKKDTYRENTSIDTITNKFHLNKHNINIHIIYLF
jgi:hypothetical protein